MEENFSILIVDDDSISRRLLERILINRGYKVTAAKDGDEALRILDKEFFPMILTDWIMPRIDGLELCRQVRRRPLPGYVFLILITAKDAKEDIIAGLEAGADDYLTKPFNQAELTARLNTGRRIINLERSLRKANQEIRILSITDPLTGCFNRLYLNEFLPQELKRAKRYIHPLSMILCDIDHFKSVNDTFGHQAGDVVLREFVKTINELIRDRVDWVARFGGEEFLVILPETPHGGAVQLAERIREHVAAKTFLAEAQSMAITASFGLTSYDPLDGEAVSPELLIARADACLYKAKREGRNRTVADPLSVRASEETSVSRLDQVGERAGETH